MSTAHGRPGEITRCLRPSPVLQWKLPRPARQRCLRISHRSPRFIFMGRTRNASSIDSFHVMLLRFLLIMRTTRHGVMTMGRSSLKVCCFDLARLTFLITAGLMNRWLSEQRGQLDVNFEDVTDRFGILAMQGPHALSILEEVTGQDWSDLQFSRGRRAEIASATVHVWRTGFTGVKGYEFWVPPEAGNDVWDALVATPTGASIEPCGHASQDIVRVEAGMVLPAIDYARAGPDVATAHSYGLVDEAYYASPFEVNLGRLVNLGKGDFVGRAALLAEAESTGVGRHMWAMCVDWRQLVVSYLAHDEIPIINGKIRRIPPMSLITNGEVAGFATSIGWSSNLKEMIGFAHLPANRDPSDAVFLRWDECEQPIDVPISLSRLPFVKPSRK